MILCFMLALLSVSSGFAEDNAFNVTYDGGSVQTTKAGTNLKMYVEQKQIRFKQGKNDLLTVPTSAITEISYGQDVHRRVGTAVVAGVFTLGVGALVALSKSKKHFIGLTWKDGDDKGGLAFQCDKNEYRGVLAGLEGVTGKKAVDSTTLTVKN